jgi:excisionase family DNA binding protein
MSKKLIEPPELPAALTVDEAAAYISVSPATIWRLLRSENLPRSRVRGRTVVRRVALDALLTQSATAATSEA